MLVAVIVAPRLLSSSPASGGRHDGTNWGCSVDGSEADRRYLRHAKNTPIAMRTTTTAADTATPITAPVLRERLFPPSGRSVLSRPVEVMVVVETNDCKGLALVVGEALVPENCVTVSDSVTQDVLTTVYHDVVGFGQ